MMLSEDHENPGGRVLAIDYGKRRVGLAISDPTGTIASGIGTLEVNSDREAIERILRGRADWGYTRIIVGLPIKESGDEGAMALAVRQFVHRLKSKLDIEVILVDERYSSMEAERLFHQSGKKLKGRKHEIDRLAAEVLLRGYLDTLDAAGGSPLE